LALGAGLGIAAETWIDADKNTCETLEKNRIKTQFMSSQVFHRTSGGRIRETTIWAQLELENLDLFNPATQEFNRDEFLQQSIHIWVKIEITLLEKIKALWGAVWLCRIDGQKAGTHTPYWPAELETGKRNSQRLPLRCGGHERCSTNRSDGKGKTGCAPSDEPGTSLSRNLRGHRRSPLFLATDKNRAANRETNH
jgi:hypothetical protein